VKLVKPKLYGEVCKKMGLDYYDYENHKLEYGTLEPYELKHKIGRGRYSEVYDSINIYNGKKCVVKVLKPGIF